MTPSEQNDSGVTVPVRVPDEMYAEVRRWAGIKGMTPGKVMQQAWLEWVRAHKAEILDDLDAMRAEIEAA